MPVVGVVVPNKVYAYMNQYGRVLEAEEFERMSADPKTQWVIATHWAGAIKLGCMEEESPCNTQK